jgi:hypothetical protein
MAYTELTAVQEEEVRRDLAGALKARQQGLLRAIVAVAPAGTTGTDGWDSDADRDAAVAAINNNRSRIEEIEQLLVDLGLLSALST